MLSVLPQLGPRQPGGGRRLDGMQRSEKLGLGGWQGDKEPVGKGVRWGIGKKSLRRVWDWDMDPRADWN